MGTLVVDGIRQAIVNGTAWRFTTEFALAAGATKLIGFVTGGYSVALEARDISSTGENTLFLLYDDTSYSGGSALSLSNRNRYFKSNTELNPIAEIKTDVTATPSGAPVTGARLLYANKGVAVIGSDADSAQIILKANTSHVLSVTNNDLQEATVGIGALFRRDVFIA